MIENYTTKPMKLEQSLLFQLCLDTLASDFYNGILVLRIVNFTFYLFICVFNLIFLERIDRLS